MKITLFMAMSVNGMTARPDYREDFLSQANWDGFVECARQSGAMIWGRKTHEKVRNASYAAEYFQPFATLKCVVVSSRPDFVAMEPGFEVAASPQDALDNLARRGCEHITLAGGSILNTSFAKAGLIDDVILNVDSFVIGRGIPLFAPDDVDLRLRLGEVRKVDDRIAQLRYEVVRA